MSPPTAAPSELKPIDQTAMQAAFDTTATDLLVPGALALVQTPTGSYTLTHGTTALDAPTAPTPGHSYRIGSVTKSMTSAVVLQLVQEGKLSLTEPIDRYIPGVPNGATITIAQLLNMRSGLHNYLETDGFATAFHQDPTKVWAPQDLVALAYAYPPSFPPGTAFEYSNTNTVLLGLLAEKLDGKPLATIFSARLFEPLGMTHTALPDATNTALPPPSIRGYQYGPLQVEDEPLTPEQQAAAVAGTLEPNDVTAQSSSWGWAAGGVVSTAEDVSTWIHALVGGKVLDAALQQQWWDSLQPLNPEAPQQLYGYGIEQIRFGKNRLTFHEGQMPGFNNIAAEDATNQVRIVVWANRALSQRTNALLLLIELIGHIYRTPGDTPPSN